MTCTEQSFLKDIAEHQMIVLRDDGLYRHIRFKKPGTGCMHFDLVTWPGYLAYSGDMGCYVFTRLEDMFNFFRTDKNDWNYNRKGGLSINLGYWSEKLVAVDGQRDSGSATEFSEEKFRRIVNDYRVRWIRDYRDTLTKEQRRELWETVQDRVLDCLMDDKHEAMRAAHTFSEDIGGRRFEFTDFWDHNFEQFTYRFIWCCYALAWGIGQYDKAKDAQESTEAALAG